MNRLYLTAIVLTCWFASSAATSGDTVVVQSAPGVRTRMSGEVLDYDGVSLRLQTATGGEQVIPSAKVLEVETPYTGEQLAARRKAAGGQPAEALPLYEKAMSVETRRWVRRVILREMIWCYRSLGRTEQAGRLFLLLAHERPSLDDMAAAPLAWSAAAPSAPLERDARQWMSQDHFQAAVLLGASHLLSTDRAAAVAKLKKLMVEADGPIAQLAAAQLWRTEVVTADATRTAAWRRAVELFPEPLRPGPSLVLGRALARQGQLDEAALAMLRGPILMPRDRDLAVGGLIEAGCVLEKLGRPRQAAGLYRELIENYPDSPEATEARSRWETLERSAAEKLKK